MYEFVIVDNKKNNQRIDSSFISQTTNLQISGIASGLLVELNIFNIILSSLGCSTLHTFVFEANSHSKFQRSGKHISQQRVAQQYCCLLLLENQAVGTLWYCFLEWTWILYLNEKVYSEWQKYKLFKHEY